MRTSNLIIIIALLVLGCKKDPPQSKLGFFQLTPSLYPLEVHVNDQYIGKIYGAPSDTIYTDVDGGKIHTYWVGSGPIQFYTDTFLVPKGINILIEL